MGLHPITDPETLADIESRFGDALNEVVATDAAGITAASVVNPEFMDDEFHEQYIDFDFLEEAVEVMQKVVPGANIFIGFHPESKYPLIVRAEGSPLAIIVAHGWPD